MRDENVGLVLAGRESRAKQWGETRDMREENMRMLSAAGESRPQQWGEMQNIRDESMCPVSATPVRRKLPQPRGRSARIVDSANDTTIIAQDPPRSAMLEPAAERRLGHESAKLPGRPHGVTNAILNLPKIEARQVSARRQGRSHSQPPGQRCVHRLSPSAGEGFASGRGRRASAPPPASARGDPTRLTQALLNYANTASSSPKRAQSRSAPACWKKRRTVCC